MLHNFRTSLRQNPRRTAGRDDRLRRRMPAIRIDIGDEESRALACKR